MGPARIGMKRTIGGTKMVVAARVGMDRKIGGTKGKHGMTAAQEKMTQGSLLPVLLQPGLK